MRFIVVVHDLDEQTWYAPLVDASDARKALDAPGDAYPNCIPVCTLNESDIKHMLNAVRKSQPDVAWRDGEGVWLR